MKLTKVFVVLFLSFILFIGCDDGSSPTNPTNPGGNVENTYSLSLGADATSNIIRFTLTGNATWKAYEDINSKSSWTAFMVSWTKISGNIDDVSDMNYTFTRVSDTVVTIALSERLSKTGSGTMKIKPFPPASVFFDKTNADATFVMGTNDPVTITIE